MGRSNRLQAPYAFKGVVAILVILCLSLWPAEVSAEKSGDWRSYGSTAASSKYSSLDQINRHNVDQLQVVWRWDSVDARVLKENTELWTMVNEATPLAVRGKLYTSTSLNQVAAIDGATGETLWSYDPEIYKEGTPANLGYNHRGVSYWESGDDRRIIFGTGNAYLIALDADTGEPLRDFGENGRVDLTLGMRRPVDRALYAVPSPPIICRGVIVVGSVILDSFSVGKSPEVPMPPGDVRGFDVLTGEQLWTFQTIPQEGEFGNDTWKDGSWMTSGNANVWTMMSADEELGFVYLPVSTPTNDFYGGHRRGENLFADSLVCVRALTGERVWHFQLIHHSLYDYDPPAAPNLVDIVVDGQEIKAVAQVSKQGFCYVFDRLTGKPVWPIEEKPVPQSQIPGEESSPTQPFPTKPAAFDLQGLTVDDLVDFTPELRQAALEIVAKFEYGLLFSPPSEKGTLLIPGVLGGANWAGAAVDPETGRLYVPSVTFPNYITVHRPPEPNSPFRYVGTLEFGPAGPHGLPLTKPPYGRMTAIDLNTGDHIWMVPIGEGPRNHPLLRDLDLPPLGWTFRNFPLLTQTLLFAVHQSEWSVRGNSPRNNAAEVVYEEEAPFLWAYDKDDGRQLTEIPLPGSANGCPMTYLADGKQFIVVAIGGASKPAELVALSLPDQQIGGN